METIDKVKHLAGVVLPQDINTVLSHHQLLARSPTHNLEERRALTETLVASVREMRKHMEGYVGFELECLLCAFHFLPCRGGIGEILEYKRMCNERECTSDTWKRMSDDEREFFWPYQIHTDELGGDKYELMVSRFLDIMNPSTLMSRNDMKELEESCVAHCDEEEKREIESGDTVPTPMSFPYNQDMRDTLKKWSAEAKVEDNDDGAEDSSGEESSDDESSSDDSSGSEYSSETDEDYGEDEENVSFKTLIRKKWALRRPSSPSCSVGEPVVPHGEEDCAKVTISPEKPVEADIPPTKLEDVILDPKFIDSITKEMFVFLKHKGYPQHIIDSLMRRQAENQVHNNCLELGKKFERQPPDIRSTEVKMTLLEHNQLLENIMSVGQSKSSGDASIIPHMKTDSTTSLPHVDFKELLNKSRPKKQDMERSMKIPDSIGVATQTEAVSNNPDASVAQHNPKRGTYDTKASKIPNITIGGRKQTPTPQKATPQPSNDPKTLARALLERMKVKNDMATLNKYFNGEQNLLRKQRIIEFRTKAKEMKLTGEENYKVWEEKYYKDRLDKKVDYVCNKYLGTDRFEREIESLESVKKEICEVETRNEREMESVKKDVGEVQMRNEREEKEVEGLERVKKEVGEVETTNEREERKLEGLESVKVGEVQMRNEREERKLEGLESVKKDVGEVQVRNEREERKLEGLESEIEMTNEREVESLETVQKEVCVCEVEMGNERENGEMDSVKKEVCENDEIRESVAVILDEIVNREKQRKKLINSLTALLNYTKKIIR